MELIEMLSMEEVTHAEVKVASPASAGVNVKRLSRSDRETESGREEQLPAQSVSPSKVREIRSLAP